MPMSSKLKPSTASILIAYLMAQPRSNALPSTLVTPTKKRPLKRSMSGPGTMSAPLIKPYSIPFINSYKKLLIPKNGINFFDQVFSEEVNQKVSAPPITIETYEKKGKTLPLLMIQGYELTPESSNKKILIRDAMVKLIGQKMAEFGFRYVDYRRKE